MTETCPHISGGVKTLSSNSAIYKEECTLCYHTQVIPSSDEDGDTKDYNNDKQDEDSDNEKEKKEV